jgi:hypothetical protein
MTIRQRLAAIVSLVLLTMVLPEMLSGNTAAEVLFRPDTFIFFACAYALPILAIREWAFRLGLHSGGIFLAGMAYALINEGLLAKTIFREAGGPIDVFDHYGFAFGINFPWALCIMVWHGLTSVLFPILLTYTFVPQSADQSWLGKRTAIIMAALAVILSSLFFVNDGSSGAKGSVAMLALLWLVMCVLAFAATFLTGKIALSANRQRLKPFLFGAFGLPVFLVVLTVAKIDAPLVIYFGMFAAIGWILQYFLRRQGWQTLPVFARVTHGWYAQMAAFGLISMVQRSIPTVIAGMLILLLVHWLLLRSERRMTT